MRPNDVLQILDKIQKEGLSKQEISPEITEALQTASLAVEKMIPMRMGVYELPVARSNHIIKPCGNCGERLENSLWEYCPWCGQKIDWGRR